MVGVGWVPGWMKISKLLISQMAILKIQAKVCLLVLPPKPHFKGLGSFQVGASLVLAPAKMPGVSPRRAQQLISLGNVTSVLNELVEEFTEHSSSPFKLSRSESRLHISLLCYS